MPDFNCKIANTVDGCTPTALQLAGRSSAGILVYFQVKIVLCAAICQCLVAPPHRDGGEWLPSLITRPPVCLSTIPLKLAPLKEERTEYYTQPVGHSGPGSWP
jgi:hypothetical protein